MASTQIKPHHYWLGIGSNLGNRRENFEVAIQSLSTHLEITGLSSIYETPALLPENAPNSWNLPYWNAVIQIQTPLAPLDLFQKLQMIETQLGRPLKKDGRPTWAPRTIDLDILLWRIDSEWKNYSDATLTIPHPQIPNRDFVLAPLNELLPQRLALNQKSLLMGILNITPDSFSDGGFYATQEILSQTLDQWDEIGLPWIDVGAESTRPGATPVSAREEWARLEPVLKVLRDRYAKKWIRPKLSLDTRHPETAARAMEFLGPSSAKHFGVSLFNDVGGLTDPDWISLLISCDVDYVLMHSLTVPASRTDVLADEVDAVDEIGKWFEDKLAVLDRSGISRSRIWLDPGIGFGKTGIQSWKLIQQIEQFQKFGCRILVGHSRKSFLHSSDKDLETLGISLALASKGVDLLRVHNPIMHHRALGAWRNSL